ncbi:MAG: class I SAM-dependent methyltransferase [Oligoflexales bacterium]
MSKVNELLQQTGLDEIFSADSFNTENIVLRDGREALLWVEKNSGHGILDLEFWEAQGYYDTKYRDDFSATIGKSDKPEELLRIYKDLNLRQFSQFKEKLDGKTKYLEVGCSFGGVLSQVAKQKGVEVWAVEPNERDVNFLSPRFPDAKILHSYFENSELPDHFFDIITSFEVLEHISKPFHFIMKLKKLLKPKCYINIEVPNHKDALLKHLNAPRYKNFYYHKAHIHYFTATSLQHLFSEAGFEGTVSGFQMYPFFNQIHWVRNNIPQPSADLALNWPEPTISNTEVEIEINRLAARISKEYNDLVENNLISDCLVYKGFLA